jgi:hypothetical protein
LNLPSTCATIIARVVSSNQPNLEPNGASEGVAAP